METRISCPWCSSEITPVWNETKVEFPIQPKDYQYGSDSIYSTCCPNCVQRILYFEWGKYPQKTERIFPTGRQALKAPNQVPQEIARDYNEAMAVLELSAKASATLSRRCLQHLLTARGYEDKDLYDQIRALLADNDPSTRLPDSIRDVVDAIRHFGNFGAHPIREDDTFKIIEMEDYEAEFSLEMLRNLFDYYYVMPDRREKERQRIKSKIEQAGKTLQS